MKAVIDANIIISALVNSNIHKLILSPRLELIAPDRLAAEMARNEDSIRRKSRLDRVDFDQLLASMMERIRLVPLEGFIDCFEEAERMLGEHKKDVPYVALALESGCPFWTYEKRFYGLVETISTAELRAYLEHYRE